MTDALAVVSMLFAAVVVVGLPWRAWRDRRIDRGPSSPLSYTILSALLSLALVLLLQWHGVALARVGLLIPEWSVLVATTVACTAIIVAVDVLSLRLLMSSQQEVTFALTPHGDAMERAVFILMCVVGSFWEELCFRGVAVLLAPPAGWPFLLAAVFSSVIFGAQHLRRGVQAACYSCGFGLLFTALYRWTGQLLPVVIAHAAGNLFVAFYSAPRYKRYLMARRSLPF